MKINMDVVRHRRVREDTNEIVGECFFLYTYANKKGEKDMRVRIGSLRQLKILHKKIGNLIHYNEFEFLYDDEK